MTPAEISAHVAAGGGFAVDTNVVWARDGRPSREFSVDLLDALRAHNSLKSAPVKVWVPALVLAERAYQSRRARSDYSDVVVNGFFDRPDFVSVLGVAPFDREVALAAASVLHSVYPDDDAWRVAKRTSLHLLVGEGVQIPAKLPGTVDWWIGAWSQASGWILITNETGLEFAWMTRRATLRQVLDALPPPP
jgi:hypothetical protein